MIPLEYLGAILEPPNVNGFRICLSEKATCSSGCAFLLGSVEQVLLAERTMLVFGHGVPDQTSLGLSLEAADTPFANCLGWEWTACS